MKSRAAGCDLILSEFSCIVLLCVDSKLITTNNIINFVVTEKLNGKPKKFTNKRVNKKPRWKERIEKKIRELRGEDDELIRGVKVKSKIERRIE